MFQDMQDLGQCWQLLSTLLKKEKINKQQKMVVRTQFLLVLLLTRLMKCALEVFVQLFLLAKISAKLKLCKIIRSCQASLKKL